MKEETILQSLLGEFFDKLATIKKLIPREAKFPNAEDKIKIAVGMRRAGKTFFLYEYIFSLLEKGISKTSILFINFEDDRLMPLDQKKLTALIDAFYRTYPENHDKKCYLFFDEIQNVEDWSQVIRRLHDTKNLEIFLTGSSAKLLSREIATSLRGRSLATEIWPYSFQEFMKAQEISIDQTLYDQKTLDKLAKTFQLYLSIGGFPEVVSYDPHVRQQTLQEYIDIVIYRDIIERHKIKNPVLIKNIILTMLHTIGRPLSINKLYNDFKTRGFNLSKDSLYEYTDYIEDTFLAFSIPLFDSSFRKSQTNPKKVYAIDPGLVRATTLDYDQDLGRLFENIVFLDIKRQGFQVNYFLTKNRQEVDFVAQGPRGEKKLFQVTWDMSNEKTFEREQSALKAGMQELNIPGEIVTLESYLKHGISI